MCMYNLQIIGKIHYSYYDCLDHSETLPDGTPLLCTPHNLFYVMGSLGGQKLADEINTFVKSQPPPTFLTVYGGLRWSTSSEGTNKTDLFSFWGDTISALDENIVPVGAQEMARLMHAAEYIDNKAINPNNNLNNKDDREKKK